MTAPKRSALAAKVLEIEDKLKAENMSAYVWPTESDWNALVRCASAVELVDAEEAATRRALVGILEDIDFEHDWRDNLELVARVRAALAGVKHE